MKFKIFSLLIITMLLFSGCAQQGDLIVKDIDDIIFSTKTLIETELVKGNAYISSDSYIVPGNSMIYIVGITGNKSISMYQRKMIAESTFNIHVDVSLYEDGILTSGVLQDNFNKNRNIADNSTFMIYNVNIGGSSIVGATLLPFSTEIKGDKKASITSSEFADYIMKTNTTYVLQVENKEPQAVTVDFSWTWLEN